MKITNIEIDSKNCVGRQNDGKQVLKYAKMICICNIYINYFNLHQVYGYLFPFSDISRKRIVNNSFLISISYG